MTRRNRTNSAASMSGSATLGAGVGRDDDNDDEAPIRYETEDDTDYVVIPTVVQREGVYEYKTNAGISREYVDGDELTGGDMTERWDGVDATLRHPVVVNEDGEAAYGLTRDPTARYTSVGEFREGGSTDEALKGELWVEESEVGRYNGDLEGYIEDIENGEIGEVSSGYGPGAVTNDRGTYNGEPYEAAQKSLNPDHVALLPDEPGNCSVADGCGAGRTNNEGDDVDLDESETLVRANGVPVGHEDGADGDDGVLDRARRAYRELHDLFGGSEGDLETFEVPGEDPRTNDSDAEEAGDEDQPDDPDGSGEVSGSDAPADDSDDDDSGDASGDQTSNEPAESGAESDNNTMQDGYDSKTDELVEEHGFDRENLPDEGEECFGRIYEKFAEASTDGEQTETETQTTETEETETDVESETVETETTETTESPETPDGVEADGGSEAEAKVNLDDVREVVREEIQAERRTEQREEHERAIVNSDAPFDEEDLEPMNADAVANIHETYVDGEAQTQQSGGRANFAGRQTPTTTSRANSNEDAPEAPVAGVKNVEARTNSGDDE